MPAIIASYVHALKFNDEPQGVGVIYGSVTGHFCLLRCSVFVLIKTAGMQPGVESIFGNISLATTGRGKIAGGAICEV
ncbi:hypothetical protein [Sinorhizobium meliloti]